MMPNYPHPQPEDLREGSWLLFCHLIFLYPLPLPQEKYPAAVHLPEGAASSCMVVRSACQPG